MRVGKGKMRPASYSRDHYFNQGSKVALSARSRRPHSSPKREWRSAKGRTAEWLAPPQVSALGRPVLSPPSSAQRILPRSLSKIWAPSGVPRARLAQAKGWLGGGQSPRQGARGRRLAV